MPPDAPTLNVGLLVAHSPTQDPGPLAAFAQRAANDATPELEASTGARWVFHAIEPTRLSNDEAHRPSDFLDEASLSMVEGPYDVVVVITDVGLVSRKRAVVAGLASEVSHVVIVSTRKLLLTPRGEPPRALADETVRWNGATVLLHVLGHVIGLPHARDPGTPMAPFFVDPARDAVPSFTPKQRARARRRVTHAMQRAITGGGWARSLSFHVVAAVRHPRKILVPPLRNRAILLPLALPTLAAAALVPTFILVFTAEIWDVGLNMGNGVAAALVIAAIAGATGYLVGVQNLFFPRKERRVLTEYMAVVNAAIFLSIFLAVVGLFTMVALLMLAVEVYVFPPGLLNTWPTLRDPSANMWDKVRIAAFISSIGVLTGALAGGFESRAVIRHLALFEDEP